MRLEPLRRTAPSSPRDRLLFFPVGVTPGGESLDFLGAACRALFVLGLVMGGLAVVVGKALGLAPAVMLGLAAVSVVPLLVGWLGLVARPSVPMLLAVAVVGYSIVDLTVRRTGVDPGGFDLQSIVKGLFWLNALVLCGWHGWRSFKSHPALVLFLAYAAYAALSAVMSPSLLLAIGGGVALLAIASLGFVLATFDEDAIGRLWKGVFVAMVLIASISLLMYFVAPDWARDYQAAGAGRLRGLTGSGNSLGPLMASGVIAGVYVLRVSGTHGRRMACVVGIALCMICLSLSQSRTALLSMIAGFGGIAMIRYPVLIAPGALLAVLFVWAGQYPGFLESKLAVLTALLSRTGDLHELTSVTGRSEIWAAVAGLVRQAPWFGHGLASPRILISQQPIDPWNIYESSHNWLLESLLSFGVAGTSLILAFLVVLGWSMLRQLRRIMSRDQPAATLHQRALVLCMAQMFLFTNVAAITEKSFAGMPHPSTVLLLLMAATTVVLQRSLAASAARPGPTTNAGMPSAPMLRLGR